MGKKPLIFLILLKLNTQKYKTELIYYYFKILDSFFQKQYNLEEKTLKTAKKSKALSYCYFS